MNHEDGSYPPVVISLLDNQTMELGDLIPVPDSKVIKSCQYNKYGGVFWVFMYNQE